MSFEFLLAIALVFQPQAAGAAPPPVAPAVEDCGCEGARPDALAIVDGAAIATVDVENDAARSVALFKTDLARLRARMLQAAITDTLFDREAARRGISRGDLIRSEALAKAVPPTEREVRDYFDRNEHGERGSFAKRKPEIAALLLEKRREQAFFAFAQQLRAAAKVEVVNESPGAPATEADRARVVATVDGMNITLGAVEDRVVPASFDLRHKIYEAEKRALDQRIEDVLLAHEAARRGMTSQELLDADVGSKVHIVTADDALAYFKTHPSEFQGLTFDAVRDRLVPYLQQTEDDRAVDAYVAALRSKAKVVIALAEPAPPEFAVAVDGRPTLGADSAQVTVVEFSDFECARCAAAHSGVRELLASYGGRVRLISRSFPLPQHAMAFAAAEAAEAAFQQGKYWEFADLVYANRERLSESMLRELAGRAGLNLKAFDAAIASHAYKGRVERDVDDGNRLGLYSTPSFFVNGRLVSDATDATLKGAIDDALARMEH